MSGSPSGVRIGLAAEHVALGPVGRRVVVDGQRAHHGRGVLGALLDVRLAADEVRVLDLGPLHAGLDDRPLAVQLGAVRAVALLHASGRAVDADADGHEPLRVAGLADQVPQLRAAAPSGRTAPSRARRRTRCGTRGRRSSRARADWQVPNLNASWLMSLSVRLPRMSRALGPQTPIVVYAEVWSTTCAEPSAGMWSRNHLRSRLPWAPPVTTRKWLSPSRMIVRSARKPPPAVDDRRVDDATGRDVHLADRNALHRVERALADDVKDRERRQVDDSGTLAHRQVLGVDDG